MKKIYGILPSLASGGAERQLLVLLEQLSCRGYDVCLVTYVVSKDAYEVPKNVKRMRIHGRGKIQDRWNLARFMWSEVRKDDVVIAFLSINYRDIVLPVLPLKRKIMAGERNLTMGQSLNRRLVFQLERKAKAIVANSYAQKEWMDKHTPWLKVKTHTVTNYTDTSKFCPRLDLLNKEEKVIIGVLARFSPQKNCMRFAQAVRVAVDSGCTNFKIVWHGDKYGMRGRMNEEYRRLQEYISNSNLEEYFEIRDKTSNVVEVNNYCDAMCLPSLFEGFSNSLSESICCGKPIIASRVSDNPIIVKEGYNGFLFNPYDVKSIASAMTKLVGLSASEFRRMGENSRKRALELFDLNKFVDSYIRIIEAM